MIIFWSVLLGVTSMLAYSGSNVWSQPLVRRLGSAQLLYLRNLFVCVVLAIVCLPSYHRFELGPVAQALLLGVAGYIPVLAFMHGLRVSRVGIVAPIGATAALFTVVLAFLLLNTPLHLVQWLAIVMIVVANVAISVNPKDLRNSNVLQLESGILFALIAAVGWGLFYFALVYPTRKIGPWLSALFVEIGVVIAAGLHVYIGKKKVDYSDALTFPVLGSGLCIAIGTATYTLGVYSYNVGIVAVLSNSTALVATLLAAYFFKEKLSRFEKIVAAVMIIGVVLVSLP